MQDLSGQVVLITGASSGIGAAAAREFARAGAQVALAARRAERLEALAHELGPAALPVPADLTQRADRERLVAETLAHFGRIDVLVNNAGLGRLGWLETLTAEEIEAQVNVNLLALMDLTRLVLPPMLARRSGHIVNIASLAGHIGAPTYAVYCATKFGVRGFSEALRREVAPFGVRVSWISPGGVAGTEFGERAGLRRRTRLTTPRRLQPTAEDVARAVVRMVRQPRREVILPWLLRLTVWINALLPGLTDRVVAEAFTKRERGCTHRLSRSGRRGRGSQ
jgi:NADP-dependent 3-hydroxy acid dehydrogenase YdfG